MSGQGNHDKYLLRYSVNGGAATQLEFGGGGGGSFTLQVNSGSTYSLLGGLRSSAQMISYEVAMGLSFVGVFLYAGSMSTSQIVAAQNKYWYAILLAPSLTPVSSEEYGARARRPPYSVLARDTLRALQIAEPRAWPEALAAYLVERRAVSAPARPGS